MHRRFTMSSCSIWRTENSVYTYRIFIYTYIKVINFCIDLLVQILGYFSEERFICEKKNAISADRMQVEIRLQDLAATINDIVKCGGNKTHCNGEKRIVRLARITSCRCPLDGLKPVDSNYEIVHRGDCDCEFKPNATRHPTRRPFASRHCVARGKSFTNNVLRGIRARYFVALSANANILLHRRTYDFVRATWHFYTTHDRSKKIPISQ